MKTYIASDFHGCPNQVVKHILNDIMEKDDHLYFLGDAADRGYDGVENLLDLLKDERVTYLLGNHEEFILGSRTAIYDEEHWFMPNSFVDNWVYTNGGNKTFYKLCDLDNNTKDFIFHRLNNALISAEYTSEIGGHKLFLGHANHADLVHASPAEIKDYVLWDRGHFNDNWHGGENEILVHGHTPVQYLEFFYGYKKNKNAPEDPTFMIRKAAWNHQNYNHKPNIITYCDGHKIDIDLCTIVSNRICLLDADTLEEYYIDFDVPERKKEEWEE